MTSSGCKSCSGVVVRILNLILIFGALFILIMTIFAIEGRRAVGTLEIILLAVGLFILVQALTSFAAGGYTSPQKGCTYRCLNFGAGATHVAIIISLFGVLLSLFAASMVTNFLMAYMKDIQESIDNMNAVAAQFMRWIAGILRTPSLIALVTGCIAAVEIWGYIQMLCTTHVAVGVRVVIMSTVGALFVLGIAQIALFVFCLVSFPFVTVHPAFLVVYIVLASLLTLATLAFIVLSNLHPIPKLKLTLDETDENNQNEDEEEDDEDESDAEDDGMEDGSSEGTARRSKRKDSTRIIKIYFVFGIVSFVLFFTVAVVFFPTRPSYLSSITSSISNACQTNTNSSSETPDTVSQSKCQPLLKRILADGCDPKKNILTICPETTMSCSCTELSLMSIENFALYANQLYLPQATYDINLMQSAAGVTALSISTLVVAVLVFIVLSRRKTIEDGVVEVVVGIDEVHRPKVLSHWESDENTGWKEPISVKRTWNRETGVPYRSEYDAG
ncbi:hypothetical protein BLNAU_14622 [Blattamonas nauphoetae]|uniref:Uncharacterized protein n=1 Tax=Blattamonas nauphoetae TaxID=2049346 RepID=A0ABQ9XGF9_9EUKA|nr:hypothetical protein BLNAU_14622 [Blattamonas nauphoetae]